MPINARTTGVLRERLVRITPGWTALAVWLVPCRRLLKCLAKSRFASLDWPYASHGL